MAGPPNTMTQQTLQVLECGVCSEEYGDDFNHVPRILRCGHTHCTKCLQNMITAKGVKCPLCSEWHPINRPDITQLPPNVSVFEILKSRAESSQPADTSQPLCEVCKKNPAAIACIDCQPEIPFKFCTDCDRKEHERNFGPVRRHRRYKADQVPVTSPFMFCTRHHGSKVLKYSKHLNEFACDRCERASDWSTRAPLFEPVTECAKRLRADLQRLNQHSREVIGKLTEARLNLEGILYELGPSASTAKAALTNKFTEVMNLIQARQQKLLSYVEAECSDRQHCLEQQLKQIETSNSLFKDAHEEVNNLIPMNDFEFLASYRDVNEKMVQLIVNEDRSLQRPRANHDFLFVVSPQVMDSMTTLGAVSGGKTPVAFRAAQNMCDLLCLSWELPADCGLLTKFEIEFEQVHNDLEGAMGTPKLNDNLIFYQNEPQYHNVAGNELKAYVDFLCPGYTYKFKLRASNAAGWGMWSESIQEKCNDFPILITYTRRIHRICIPESAHYRITAKGAKAEDGSKFTGGKGAIISGIFSLQKGDILILLCGGKSTKQEYSSGGGGGTFVAKNEITLDNLLIVAGGGGGTRGLEVGDCNGADASVDINGTDGRGLQHGKGGVDGAPGEDADSSDFPGPSWGHGGAGVLSDATTASSFLHGGHGGRNGGFGGGGGVGSWGGGGGGGYSGGGGGRGGGGGGSFVHPDATHVKKRVGNEEAGSIYIEKADPPYPVEWEPIESNQKIAQVNPLEPKPNEANQKVNPLESKPIEVDESIRQVNPPYTLESKASESSIWSEGPEVLTRQNTGSSGYVTRPDLNSYPSQASNSSGNPSQPPGNENGVRPTPASSHDSSQPSSQGSSRADTVNAEIATASISSSSQSSSPGSTSNVGVSPTNLITPSPAENNLQPIQEVIAARMQTVEESSRVQDLVNKYPYAQQPVELHQSQLPTIHQYTAQSEPLHTTTGTQGNQSFHTVHSEPFMPVRTQQGPLPYPPASTVFTPPDPNLPPNPYPTSRYDQPPVLSHPAQIQDPSSYRQEPPQP